MAPTAGTSSVPIASNAATSAKCPKTGATIDERIGTAALQKDTPPEIQRRDRDTERERDREREK